MAGDGIPHTARDLGVASDRLDDLARMAAGAAEMRRMYEAALAGSLDPAP